MRAGGTGLADLSTLLSIVLLVASGALAIGVFLYSQYLQSSLASKADQLARASAAFEPSLIRELTRLDERMRAAGEVLGSHIAPSAFFHMLEATTIQTTSFRNLTFQTGEDKVMTIKMSGLAESVNSIAYQADLFSKIGMITSPIFSNIDRQPEGVRFDLSAHLNPSALNYAALIRAASQQLPQDAQQTEAPPAAAEETSPFTAPQETGEGGGALENTQVTPTSGATQ
ncbi:hypothetical protein C4585_01215 [Candidatus Parcubacteria bacterium]|nr:MAG: hypothetical protein C4585_01215 [Candidatus Parcubacteria bacterium]